MQIRVLLADDHEMMRAGLRAILEQHRIPVVGEAADGRTAVKMALELSPEVALMDISMPELNGIEAARQIVNSGVGTRIVMLSMHADRHYVVDSLRAGASGYLLKTSAAGELMLALEAIGRGDTYLSPRVAEVVVDSYVRNPDRQEADAPDVLTAREREVLQLLAEGKTSKEIGADLHITPKTVETHRAQVSRKLGIRSVALLTKYAVRAGLTQLDT